SQNYYTFKGLTIRGSGSNGIWGYGDHITVDHCNIKFNGKAAVSFQLPGAADNQVLYSHIYQNVLLNWPRGNNGYADAGGSWPGTVIWYAGLRPVARGNIVHMNGGEGILSYGSQSGTTSGSALFEQNVVYDNWSVNIYFDNQPNNVARNNIIFNHPADTSTWLYPPTSPYPWNALYKYSVCIMLADEQNSSDATNNYANLANTRVYNNLLAGCRIGIRDYSEGATTVQYHGLKNTLIANNTIILPPGPLPNTDVMGIFLQDNGSRNVGSSIQNNVVYGFSSGTPLIWIQGTNSLSGVSMNNNVYYSAAAKPFRIGYNSVQDVSFANWQSQTGADFLGRFTDPLLVGASLFQAPGTAPYDYNNANLQATSPAVGVGATQTVFSNNLPGATRSVWNAGAF
ncbi:right-handed parallel beta-helix repeat-containing protein, partial [Rudaea sp.]|uniref:right-handed parallel beta-helix repeat-containing protein n=1 Tax=Rudaea sp. TaxID=2136325 RepID=UPI0032204722